MKADESGGYATHHQESVPDPAMHRLSTQVAGLQPVIVDHPAYSGLAELELLAAVYSTQDQRGLEDGERSASVAYAEEEIEVELGASLFGVAADRQNWVSAKND